jgi:branched-chain amino acid aminotransferase
VSAAELACINGEVVPLAQAVIPVSDEGLLRGDGVFEVMRLYDGVPYAADRHLARMASSARNLRLELDIEQVGADIGRLLDAARPGDAMLRVLATRGGRRITLIEALPEMPASIALGCVTYAPVRLLDGVKSLSYAANMLATRLARERGFDDALLVTPHGRVLEAPTASFFWARDGELRTPPLSDHLLDSITRRVVIDDVGAIEVETARDELDHAEEAFVASSVREVMAVHRIEQLELRPGGPLTEAAAAAVRARVAAELQRG